MLNKNDWLEDAKEYERELKKQEMDDQKAEKISRVITSLNCSLMVISDITRIIKKSECEKCVKVGKALDEFNKIYDDLNTKRKK